MAKPIPAAGNSTVAGNRSNMLCLLFRRLQSRDVQHKLAVELEFEAVFLHLLAGLA